jgi:hypothetical protein
LKTASDANTEQFKHDSGVLIQRLKRDHGGCLSALACLYYLAREYLQRVQVEHGKNMRPIIDILTQWGTGQSQTDTHGRNARLHWTTWNRPC